MVTGAALLLLIACVGQLEGSVTLEKKNALLEEPLPFEVPLPAECTVAGTNANSYNQGQCSRQPCRLPSGECARSWQCCYEVDKLSPVRFACSDSQNLLSGSVVVLCRCQVCSKLRARIKGRVLSSRDHKPVVLAAIMIGSEIATFTDQEGRFFFELTTNDRKVTLFIHEAGHRHFEVPVEVHPSLNHDITVVLEYIQAVVPVEKLQDTFDVQLASSVAIERHGINISLHFSPESLVVPDTNEVYSGPGQVLHSLYHLGNWPDFTSPAVHHMLYKDSRGAEFSIQSYVIGTLSVVDEDGQLLALRSGTPIPMTATIKFDSYIESANVAKLHLFVYSEPESRWLDHGRLVVLKVHQPKDEIATVATLLGKLRGLNPIWTVGFPSRVTCHVKARAFHRTGHKELAGLAISLEQSDDQFGQPTFYRQTAKTVAGVGACLKSVCGLGGIVSAFPDADIAVEAVAPPVKNGIILGNEKEIMFYTTERSQILVGGKTPYYISEAACMQSIQTPTGYFKFVTNSSFIPPITPLILSPAADESATKTQYCFIKVAVYDCAAFTDVKVLSYSSDGQLLSMNADIATPPSGALILEACQSGVSQLRASCVEYQCGSKVHVTVQSRVGTSETKDCRYWSSSPTTLWSSPSVHNQTSFHVSDSDWDLGGLFRASSPELARMKCYSGSNREPDNSIDPYKGMAVTFTC